MFRRSNRGPFEFSRRRESALRHLVQGIQDEKIALLVESGSAYEWVARDWVHEDLDGEVRRGYQPFSNGQRFPRDSEQGNSDEYDLEHCRCELVKAEDG